MMATAKNKDGSLLSPVQLQLVTPGGPALTNHVGCLINNKLYVHGGINKKMSTVPLNGLYCLDIGCAPPIWQEIRQEDSPALSHHASVVLGNRYMFIVGGWDGKVRRSSVYAYDTVENRWLHPQTFGFPEGAGLSSHTLTLLENGNILVIGREGSARLQRRFGNAWTLSGSISKGKFTYREEDIELASRSGHTTHTLGSQLYIIGGRVDKHIEIHHGYRSPQPVFRNMAKLVDLSKSSAPMAKPPCGRKQHVSTAGAGMVIVHGGETFDGKSRDPVGEFYLITFKPNIQWFKLGISDVGRAGHVCCVSESNIILHGGLGSKGVVHGETYQLEIR